MRKMVLIMLACSGWSFAGGPKNTYPTPRGMDDEMQNIYHDLKNPVINYGSASSFTVTSLSASTATLISSATITNLTVTGTLSGGHYPQSPVQTTETTGQTTNSNSFVDGGASASITPTSSSSKIKVTVVGVFINDNANDIAAIGLERTNGSVDLFTTSSTPIQIIPEAANVVIPYCLVYIDSPATTSQVTYKNRLALISGTGSVHIGGAARTGSTTIMILEEVN